MSAAKLKIKNYAIISLSKLIGISMNRKLKYIYKYIKIKALRNKINFFLFISVVMIFIGILLSTIDKSKIGPFFDEIGSVIFNLSIGYIVTYIFYYLTVVIKDVEQKSKTYGNIINLNNRLVYDALEMYLFLFKIYNRKYHRMLLFTKCKIALPIEETILKRSDSIINDIIAQQYQYINESIINKFGEDFHINHLLDHMSTNLSSISNTRPIDNFVSVHNLYFTKEDLIEMGKLIQLNDTVECVKSATNNAFHYWEVNDYIMLTLDNMKNQIDKILGYSIMLPIDYMALINDLEQHMYHKTFSIIINRRKNCNLGTATMELLYILYRHINNLRFAGIRLSVELHRLNKKPSLKQMIINLLKK